MGGICEVDWSGSGFEPVTGWSEDANKCLSFLKDWGRWVPRVSANTFNNYGCLGISKIIASHNGVTYSSLLNQSVIVSNTAPPSTSVHISWHEFQNSRSREAPASATIHEESLSLPNFFLLCNLPQWGKCITVPTDWVLTIKTPQCSKWAAHNVVITSDSVFVNCGTDFAECS
jgi:hypothetical protein